MGAKSWQLAPGVNHVGAYQVSGRPFASGSINTTGSASASKLEFPTVTRWIQIINRDPMNAAKVGFSSLGVAGSNHFNVSAPSDYKSGEASPVFEVKVSEIYLTGSGNIDVVAGLTNIDKARVSGSIGPSWSGSVGVG